MIRRVGARKRRRSRGGVRTAGYMQCSSRVSLAYSRRESRSQYAGQVGKPGRREIGDCVSVRIVATVYARVPLARPSPSTFPLFSSRAPVLGLASPSTKNKLDRSDMTSSGFGGGRGFL